MSATRGTPLPDGPDGAPASAPNTPGPSAPGGSSTPAPSARSGSSAPASAVAAQGLTVRFGTGHRAMTAVDGVDLDVPAGQVVGLVGESGSGKSTLARALAGLVPPYAGRVLVGGRDRAALPLERRRRVQMVFQDPYASLNPRMTVGETLGEVAAVGRRLDRRSRAAEVGRLLELVALEPRHAAMLPRELSGGQRQRVAIARALAAGPDVLIADEITSALDVSVQGAILNLIRDLSAELGLTILFISHNLAVVRYISDSIAVMYLGRIVERAATADLVSRPRHPYTRALLDAVPRLGATPADGATALDADPPDPHDPPSGCHFHPRCPVGPGVRADRDVCATDDPGEDAAARPHRAACHFAAPALVRDPGEREAADAR